MMGLRPVSWLVLAAMVVSGCVWSGGASQLPATTAASQGMKLSIDNETKIAVTLVVNGSVIETVPPGGYEDPIKGNLPPLPWNVETRSPSGRVLSTLVVHQGDFWQTSMPNGEGGAKGDSVRVDLSCGRLDLWYGTPMLGPAFVPGPSGDCA
jgi:hypothetical protein